MLSLLILLLGHTSFGITDTYGATISRFLFTNGGVMNGGNVGTMGTDSVLD